LTRSPLQILPVQNTGQSTTKEIIAPELNVIRHDIITSKSNKLAYYSNSNCTNVEMFTVLDSIMGTKEDTQYLNSILHNSAQIMGILVSPKKDIMYPILLTKNRSHHVYTVNMIGIPKNEYLPLQFLYDNISDILECILQILSSKLCTSKNFKIKFGVYTLIYDHDKYIGFKNTDSATFRSVPEIQRQKIPLLKDISINMLNAIKGETNRF